MNWRAISCLFYNNSNSAESYGGTLSALTSSVLSGNRANIGGAVYLGNTNNYMAIISCQISHNEARAYGGGVVSLCAIFALYRSTIFSNTAPESGGIHVDENINTIIIDVLFERNIALSGRGGGSTILGNGDVLISRSNFSSNIATNGGGVYLSSSMGWIGHCVFESNIVTESGTWIVLQCKTINF
jgi:hypothetical protein